MRVNRILRLVHAVLAWVLVAAILYQVYLAGSAIANLGGSGDFAGHAEFGYTAVGLAALATFLSALGARLGRGHTVLALLVVVDYIVQTILPSFKGDNAALAALHPVNALIRFGLAIMVARRATGAYRAGAAAAAPMA